MSQPSEAYEVVKHIHDSFFAINNNLTAEEIVKSPVKADPDSEPYHTPKLYIRGEYEGLDAYQTLSRGKNGTYYLSTVFAEVGGELRLSRFTPKSPPEKIGELVSSLYMRVLVDIANLRQE